MQETAGQRNSPVATPLGHHAPAGQRVPLQLPQACRRLLRKRRRSAWAPGRWPPAAPPSGGPGGRPRRDQGSARATPWQPGGHGAAAEPDLPLDLDPAAHRPACPQHLAGQRRRCCGHAPARQKLAKQRPLGRKRAAPMAAPSAATAQSATAAARRAGEQWRGPRARRMPRPHLL